MKNLILIAGPPCTGKTLFAEYLSGKINIPWVSKDSIKERLFDSIGFKSREEKMALGTASMEIMYYLAENQLKAGLSLILENNFENASKPGLFRLIELYRCGIITVRFHTSQDVLEKRLLERNNSPSRHPAHANDTCYPPPPFSPPAPVRSSEEFWNNMRERGMHNFSVGGKEILVDTTDFNLVSYDKLCEEILQLF